MGEIVVEASVVVGAFVGAQAETDEEMPIVEAVAVAVAAVAVAVAVAVAAVTVTVAVAGASESVSAVEVGADSSEGAARGAAVRAGVADVGAIGVGLGV